MAFSKDALVIDAPAASARIEEALRAQVLGMLRRKGVVVGLSGGIDSSVVCGLAVRALGRERVFGLFMPERDSSGDSLRLGRMVAEAFGIEAVVEDIAPALAGAGCYARQEEAIRMVFPAYGEGWKCKITLPSILETDRLNVSQLTVESPSGEQQSARLPLTAYLQLVAATNFKQRIRKMTEYYHADRLHYAVTGTPNRLEYDQGFFVKQGDGAADVKPIAHLYKTQVYALAEHLGVPEEIRSARPPPTPSRSRRRKKSSTSPCPTTAWTSACTRTTTACRRPRSARWWGSRRAGRARVQGHRVEAAGDALLAQLAAARREGVRGGALLVRSEVRPAACAASRASITSPTATPRPRARCSRRWRARCCIAAPTSSAATATTGSASRTRASRSSTWRRASSPLANEDGTLFIVFNGEIFNYVELRAELEALGHRFRTQERHRGHRARVGAWGDRGVRAHERPVGRRALGRDRSVTSSCSARDRVGVRPLHFTEHDGRLFFASEVKALFAPTPRCRASSTPSASIETFTFWASARRTSVFAASSSSSRAHVRIWQSGAPRATCRLLVARATPTVRGEGPSDGFGFEGSLDEATRRARRSSERHLAAHAARRRARGQLPLGRARQLAGGGARPRGRRASASRPSRCASPTPSTTRPSTSARW
jgi:NAD+ synthase